MADTLASADSLRKQIKTHYEAQLDQLVGEKVDELKEKYEIILEGERTRFDSMVYHNECEIKQLKFQ